MDDARRCTAHSSRTGDRCKKAPILGDSYVAPPVAARPGHA